MKTLSLSVLTEAVNRLPRVRHGASVVITVPDRIHQLNLGVYKNVEQIDYSLNEIELTFNAIEYREDSNVWLEWELVL